HAPASTRPVLVALYSPTALPPARAVAATEPAAAEPVVAWPELGYCVRGETTTAGAETSIPAHSAILRPCDDECCRQKAIPWRFAACANHLHRHTAVCG